MEAPRNRKLEAAKQIAELVHHNQYDKSGASYIWHPKRVAESVEDFLIFDEDCETAVLAAWLHDVIEDSRDTIAPFTEKNILDFGIPAKVVEIVSLLTFTASSSQTDGSEIQQVAAKFSDKLDYYAAIKGNRLARIVKMCDLADNCNLSRVEAMRRHSKDAVNPDKYPLALAALNLSPSEWEWFNERIRIPV